MSTFDSTGASIDSLGETRQKIADAVLAVLGDDMAVDNEDSVIGKIVTIAARVADNANLGIQHAVAVRDPDSASGTGLQKLVKLNGITANEAEFSTVALSVYANAYGTVIQAGDKVFDPNTPEILWSIDSGVTVTPHSSASISATCETAGAIPALEGTITSIKTPRQGWSTVTNPSAAALGATAESDPALRRRRERVARSYGKSTLYGVWAALEDLDNATDVYVHENLENENDIYGTPARSLHAFIRGGSDADIAEILFRTAPIKTHGTTTISHVHRGQSHTIKFSRPTDTGVTVSVTFSPINSVLSPSFPSWAEAAVRTAIVDFFAAYQLMGISAIPQQISNAASVVTGFYVSASLVNGSASILNADMGEAFTITEDDITVISA